MKKAQPSELMKTSAKAATVVSGWSPSKQEYALRVINNNAFCATPNRLCGAYINDDGDAA